MRPTRDWAIVAIPCPRGRVLGGTSAINGMVYIRGNRHDFDGWAANGAEGWNYDSVLPYFKKSENYQHGASEYHSVGGELTVSDQRDPNPVGQIAIEGATQLQHRRTPDFNGEEQDGFGFWQVTQKRGQRASTARAFLDPVRGRPNLTIITDALTERIDLDGKRVTGITLRRRDGGPAILKARREVIISGGAINSPQILLLSGIGPAADLNGFGITVRHDLPGVGENLHDHQGIFMTWSSPDTRLYGLSSGSLPWLAASPFKYLTRTQGRLDDEYVRGRRLRPLAARPQAARPAIVFLSAIHEPAAAFHSARPRLLLACLAVAAQEPGQIDVEDDAARRAAAPDLGLPDA